jgi:hypothetical protein
MKRFLSIVVILIIATLSILGVVYLYKQEKTEPVTTAQPISPNVLSSLPLSFQENRGQVEIRRKQSFSRQTTFFTHSLE